MIEIAEPQQAMWNAASHILGVTVTEDQPVRVRRGRTMTQSGAIEYWHEKHDLDEQVRAELQARQTYERYSDRRFIGAIYRRIKPEVKSALTSGGNLILHRASGSGTIYLGRQGGDVTVFRLTDEELSIFSPSEVLAYSDTLTAVDDDHIDMRLGAILDRTNVWSLSGSGDLATATAGEVVIIEVDEAAPALIEAEAILAMTSGLSIATPDNYKNKILQRGVAEALKYLPHNLDLGRRRVWLIAEGTGRLIIRSSD